MCFFNLSLLLINFTQIKKKENIERERDSELEVDCNIDTCQTNQISLVKNQLSIVTVMDGEIITYFKKQNKTKRN